MSEGKSNKYRREIRPGVWVDVYDVLAAWDVKNPALQHLIKKALQPGGRGHKSIQQDLHDILVSAARAIELEEQAARLLAGTKTANLGPEIFYATR